MSLLHDRVAPLITTIVVPLTVAITGVLAWNLNRSVSTMDREIKTREQIHLETTSDRDFQFKIYEAVTNSLETTDVRKQRVAKALIFAMLADDDPLRAGLLEVLSAEGSEEIRTEAAAALSELGRFTADQAEIQHQAIVTGTDWQSYNYDIFWCTANGDDNRETANRVLESFRQANVKGRLRLRELPASINASPGYRISGLMIRRESGEEAAASDAKQIADTVIGGRGNGFVQSLSRQRTPNYISLFVCR